MALWQFDLFLIPQLGSAPTLGADGWVLPLVPARAVHSARGLISSWLGEPRFICEDIAVFGAETGNRIDILPGQDGGAEICARIDARAESLQFCRLLNELASGLDCKFFSPEFACEIGTETQDLVEALMRSRAWSYALSPAATLRRLANGPQVPQADSRRS
ncbi:hypothetical protein [Ideonella sp.]|uniref:hypothetical protein n=1 Tax=Ideonella sp. TaxID=1929293 RepID=UPI0035AF0C26